MGFEAPMVVRDHEVAAEHIDLPAEEPPGERELRWQRKEWCRKLNWRRDQVCPTTSW